METSLKNRKDSTSGARSPRSSASRGGTRTGFVAKKKVQNAFLNEVLSPIPSVNLPVCDKPFGQVTENGVAYWTYKNEFKIDAASNIEYLAAAVEAYCNIQCAEFDFTPSENALADLSELLRIAKSVAPTDHEISLDYDEKMNMIVILEYDLCDFDYNTLFFFPVSFVEKLPKELRPIVKSAYSVLSICNYAQMPEDHCDASYVLGLWDEGEQLAELKNEDEERYNELKSFIDSYLEGEIHQLICECSSFPKDLDKMRNDLEEARTKYAGTQYGPLINSLRDGLILRDEDTWMNYSRTPCFCNIEDFDEHDEGMMDPSRLFVMVYDLMDEIVEGITDCINGEAGSLDVSGLYDFRKLTPDIDTEFCASDFPKRWSEWFGSFVDITEHIGNEQSTDTCAG